MLGGFLAPSQPAFAVRDCPDRARPHEKAHHPGRTAGNRFFQEPYAECFAAFGLFLAAVLT